MDLLLFVEYLFQRIFVLYEHLSCFTAFKWADNACSFQLVHDSPCAVVADGEAALYGGCGTLLTVYDQPGSFFKQGVAGA